MNNDIFPFEEDWNKKTDDTKLFTSPKSAHVKEVADWIEKYKRMERELEETNIYRRIFKEEKRYGTITKLIKKNKNE